MRIKTFVIFFLTSLSVPLCLQAQEKGEYVNQIKLSPIRLVDLVNPGIEIGYERRFTDRLATQVTAGWMKEFFQTTPFWNYGGYRFSLEQKYFLRERAYKNRYLSLEGVWGKLDYNDQSLFSEDTVWSSPDYTDTFRLSKKTFSISIKYGVQIPLNRLLFDFSVGFGARHRIATRSGLSNRPHYEHGPRHPNVYYESNREGNSWVPNVAGNLRVAWTF